MSGILEQVEENDTGREKRGEVDLEVGGPQINSGSAWSKLFSVGLNQVGNKPIGLESNAASIGQDFFDAMCVLIICNLGTMSKAYRPQHDG